MNLPLTGAISETVHTMGTLLLQRTDVYYPIFALIDATYLHTVPSILHMGPGDVCRCIRFVALQTRFFGEGL